MKLGCLVGGIATMGLAIVLSVNFVSELSSLVAGMLIIFSLGLVGYGSLIADIRTEASGKKEPKY